MHNSEEVNRSKLTIFNFSEANTLYLLSLVEFSSINEIKRTSNIESYLHALLKATNYSIRVLAYTSSGDGVSSIPIFCATGEDGKFVLKLQNDRKLIKNIVS